MAENKSKLGWILGGVGALVFACFVFYLVDPRWFGERFIHFDAARKVRHLRERGAAT